MSHHFIWLYATTILLVSIIPGPTMLLALTHGIQYGVKRSMVSALGNVTVTLLQAFISIVGLGAVLLTSATVFLIIKWAGAGYLVYMGIRVLLSSKNSSLSQSGDKTAKQSSLAKMFLQAALVTAGNPKAIVFFSAIFPQFLNPDDELLWQSCMLLSICAAIAFACFMLYAIGGRKMVAVFSELSLGKIIHRLIGGTFIGAGIGLAISGRS